jgi:hypothetical protein
MVGRADHTRAADAIPLYRTGIRSEPDCNPVDHRRRGLGGTAHGDGRNAIGFAACASTVLNLTAS